MLEETSLSPSFFAPGTVTLLSNLYIFPSGVTKRVVATNDCGSVPKLLYMTIVPLAFLPTESVPLAVYLFVMFFSEEKTTPLSLRVFSLTALSSNTGETLRLPIYPCSVLSSARVTVTLGKKIIAPATKATPTNPAPIQIKLFLPLLISCREPLYAPNSTSSSSISPDLSDPTTERTFLVLWGLGDFLGALTLIEDLPPRGTISETVFLPLPKNGLVASMPKERAFPIVSSSTDSTLKVLPAASTSLWSSCKSFLLSATSASRGMYKMTSSSSALSTLSIAEAVESDLFRYIFLLTT